MKNCIYLMASILLIISGCETYNTVPIETSTVSTYGDFLPASPINGFPIGTGDELQIIVWKNDDLNRTFRVPPSGYIFYPLIGKLNVIGMGTEDLRLKITEGLSDYIFSPQVNVDLVAFRSRKLAILGEVNKPGRYTMEGVLSIIDAISLAGDMTNHANAKRVILMRPSDNELQLYAINVDDLFRKGDTTQMVFLESGDTILVPPTAIENIARFGDYMYRTFRGTRELGRSIVLFDEVYKIITGEENSSRIFINLGE